MSGTGETKDYPQISVMALERDLNQMRESGFWPERVECGLEVFEALMHLTVYGQQWPARDFWEEERRTALEARMRAQLLAGVTDMAFNGIPVRLKLDVPEGRFWPSRERETSIFLPGAAREAAHAPA